MSASISVTEADFANISGAAWDAQAAGNRELAKALDKLARKANAALSNARLSKMTRNGFGKTAPGLTWRDVPSVFPAE